MVACAAGAPAIVLCTRLIRYRERRSPPPGYRQGLITAITVLLGFSLAFLRFWGLEAAGQWTARSSPRSP